jgi:ABC-2 type transport system ATP-binding protein
MATNDAILVEGLRKSFDKLTVLDGVDFSVPRGTVLALLGPNGAGKTTIIRILSTLLPKDDGTALVNGFDVKTQANDVRKSIGLTGQYAAVDELLTGNENLIMMGRLYHLSSADARVRGKELLERFDLIDAADRPVRTYSGGMRRRLDLALSIITTPPILFLDEPTTGLDPRSRLGMWEIIKQLVDSGVSILLTTQYLEEADQLANKIAVIDGGKIIAQGTSEELKSRAGKERLELTLKKGNDFAKAIAIVDGQLLEKDERERKLIVAMEGAHEVKRILDLFENAKMDVETLSLHKPTLDDVFLQLTGHKTEKEKTDE